MSDLVLMIAGQSNGSQMCTVPVAGCDPIAGTYVWQPNTTWRAMTSSDGAGMVELARMLKASGGFDNIFVYNCCYGGSSVVPNATDPAHPENCWQNQNPGGPLADCKAQVSVGAKVPQFVIWMQGEQESLYSSTNPSFDMVTNYKLCLDQLRNYLLGQWGVTSSQCIWMVTPVGKINYGTTKYVLQSQQLYFNATSGVIPGPARYDSPLVDGVHMTGPGCRLIGDRIARALLANLGVSGFANCGPGPQITSSWKGGTTVAIATNSTTGIVAYPGTSFLTGFQVYDYWYSHLIGINGAWVSAGLIFLSLAENPGDGNHIHILYQADNAQNPGSPSFDQQQPFLNWGSPLLPCYGIETAN